MFWSIEFYCWIDIDQIGKYRGGDESFIIQPRGTTFLKLDFYSIFRQFHRIVESLIILLLLPRKNTCWSFRRFHRGGGNFI